MSAERLDEIKARADAATPGPWEQCGDSGTPWNDIVVGPHPSGNESWCDTVADCDTSEENAAFIAAAREDVPWLVEQVARLTAERDAQIKRAERLERWYADALTMLDKSRRWKSVASLTAERDSLAQIKRHIDEVRNGTGWTVQIYGVLLQQCDQYGKTIDTRRAERAEAERDALAAQVARVEALAEDWRYKGQFGWGPWQIGEGPDPEGYVMDHCASAIRAALADPEADTTDVDVCSGDADCTSALHVHGCFADTAGPCTDPDEHQPTDQEVSDE